MTTSSSPPRIRTSRMWSTVALELVVVGGLLLTYRAARVLTGHPGAVAFDNARALLLWERVLPLPYELHVQQLLLSSEAVTRLANAYYATVHFPLTGAFLVWLFVRSRPDYYRIRTSLAVLTGLAMAVHAAFPLAPARMLTGHGFVDTAAAYGPAVYGSPETDSLTNQFAAMPSLHFGWAVMVAVGAIRVGRWRYRMLWIAHPVITLLVIVGTANHYWLDAAVAGALVVLAEYAVAAWWGIGRITGPVPVLEWRGFGAEWRNLSLELAGSPRFCTSRRWSRSRGPPSGLR
jgi:PAP2 superfamily